MQRDDAYLLDMLIYARKAKSIAHGQTKQTFLASEVLQLAALHVLQTIGEAAAKVSPKFRQSHPEIPWGRIIGLRHRVVHDYPRIDLVRVWQVLSEDIEPLIKNLEPLVPPDTP